MFAATPTAPRPSCPDPFAPQHLIWPVAAIAHVFWLPAASVTGSPGSPPFGQHATPSAVRHSTCSPLHMPLGLPLVPPLAPLVPPLAPLVPLLAPPPSPRTFT